MKKEIARTLGLLKENSTEAKGTVSHLYDLLWCEFSFSLSLASMEKKNFDLIEIMKQGMKLARARPATGRGAKKAKVLLSFHYFSLLVSHWVFSFY